MKIDNGILTANVLLGDQKSADLMGEANAENFWSECQIEVPRIIGWYKIPEEEEDGYMAAGNVKVVLDGGAETWILDIKYETFCDTIKRYRDEILQNQAPEDVVRFIM